MIANQELWQKLVKEHAELQEIVEKYDAYLENEKQVGELHEMLHDPESADMAEMIEEELAELQKSGPSWRKSSSCFSSPSDPQR